MLDYNIDYNFILVELMYERFWTKVVLQNQLCYDFFPPNHEGI